MTHVFDVVKLGLPSTSKKCIYQAAWTGNGLGCADDNSPDIQEPDEARVCAVVRTERITTRSGRRSG